MKKTNSLLARIIILAFSVFAIAFMPSCESLKGLGLGDTVEELKEAFKNAPIVLETKYQGEVIRVVLREGKQEALDADGNKYPVDDVVAASVKES